MKLVAKYQIPVINSCLEKCEASGLFSPGTPVSSTNKTDRHDIAEILLKVALNTITLTLYFYLFDIVDIRMIDKQWITTSFFFSN
jgi:hypothetical protein